MRRAAAFLLALAALGALLGDSVASTGYDRQSRDALGVPPDSSHPLGTDGLGRDRLARVLYGSRVSLLLAPAAALLAVMLAAAVGGVAGLAGGRVDRLLLSATDLALALPWFFLTVTVRALLPLDASPWLSVVITFTLLGLLGWPESALVVRAGVRQILQAEYVLAARSRGLGRSAILFRHLLPNLRPVLAAQFGACVPGFILAEANLSLLGLGVAEPLPSWGNLLRELESCAGLGNLAREWWLLAPAGLMLAVVACFRILFPREIST